MGGRKKGNSKGNPTVFDMVQEKKIANGPKMRLSKSQQRDRIEETNRNQVGEGESTLGKAITPYTICVSRGMVVKWYRMMRKEKRGNGYEFLRSNQDLE